jgi:hypothetical protein
MIQKGRHKDAKKEEYLKPPSGEIKDPSESDLSHTCPSNK